MISGQWSLWEHQNDLSWTSPPPTNTIWWFSTLTAPHKDLELQLIYAIHGKNLLFWRSILRDVGLTCSLFLVMCTSSTSVVNGKNCIQEWTPKDTYRNEIGIRPWNTSMPWSQYDLIRLGDPLVSVQFSQDSLYLLECQVFVRQSTQSCLNIIHFLRLCGSTVCIPQRRPSLYLGPSDFVWFLATRLNVSSKKQK